MPAIILPTIGCGVGFGNVCCWPLVLIGRGEVGGLYIERGCSLLDHWQILLQKH